MKNLLIISIGLKRAFEKKFFVKSMCISVFALVLFTAFNVQAQSGYFSEEALASISIQADKNELIEDAQKLFKSGQYESAAQIYESLIQDANKNDFRKSDLMFNAGTALGKYSLKRADDDDSRTSDFALAWAIYYLISAKKMDPLNKSVNENLDKLRKVAKAKNSDPSLIYSESSLDFSYYSRIVGEVSLILGLWLFVPVLIFFMFFKSPFFYWLARLLLVLACMVLAFSMLSETVIGEKTGVALGTPLAVFSSPSADDLPALKLVAGTEFSLKTRDGQWVEIILGNGTSGWVLSDGIIDLE